MSSHDVDLPTIASIPRPRTSDQASVVPTELEPDVPAVRTSWTEPGHPAGGARPRTEYWDVHTASWRS